MRVLLSPPQRRPWPRTERQRRAAAAAAEKQRAEEEAQRRAAELPHAEKRRADEEAQRQAAATAAEKQRTAEEAQREAAAEQARRQQAETEPASKPRSPPVSRLLPRTHNGRRPRTPGRRRRPRKRGARPPRPSSAKPRGSWPSRLAEKAIAEDNARNAEADAEKARGRGGSSRPQGGGGGAKRRCISAPSTASGSRWRSPHRASTRAAPMACSALTRARWSRPGKPLAACRRPGSSTRAQRQRLIGDSAAAVAKFDAEQKKAADEEARRREQARPDATTAAVGPVAPRLPTPSPPAFAGRWSLVRSKCIPSTPQRFFGVTVEGNRFSYGFTFANRTASCSVAIGPDGSFANNSCEAPLSGRISGNRMTLSQRHPEAICDFEFQKQ